MRQIFNIFQVKNRFNLKLRNLVIFPSCDKALIRVTSPAKNLKNAETEQQKFIVKNDKQIHRSLPLVTQKL